MNRWWHVLYLSIITAVLGCCIYCALAGSFSCRQTLGFNRLSTAEVKELMGSPAKVFRPGETLASYGAIPRPPTPRSGQEVWVYRRLMHLTFVYFDSTGHVQMVFHATT